MALDAWLIKVKKTIQNSFDSLRAASLSEKRLVHSKSSVGVLAFEVAGIMSKLLHLWQSLSPKSVQRLRRDSICLEGIRKIVSNDDPFLLSLACAELVGNLQTVAKSVSCISKKCSDSSLWCFDRLFDEFANAGHDPCNWVLGSKEMEFKNKKLDSYVAATALLYREMTELAVLENGLKAVLSLPSKNLDCSINLEKNTVDELQRKIMLQRQQVKLVKMKSLWCRSFDHVTRLLIPSVFTILARIKLVFGVGKVLPPSLPRNLSIVHPSENMYASEFESSKNVQTDLGHGFFELNFKILEPPCGTLGAAALASHYASLINVLEKMIKSPQSIGIDARDDLYSMLPNSIRLRLRARLKGVGYLAGDVNLAAEWRHALRKIMGWLSPLAHNMVKWQSERCFEQQNLMVSENYNNVLLLQTLYFANLEKTEAAITELLMGLNYVWRFEKQNMNKMGLLQHTV